MNMDIINRKRLKDISRVFNYTTSIAYFIKTFYGIAYKYNNIHIVSFIMSHFHV